MTPLPPNADKAQTAAWDAFAAKMRAHIAAARRAQAQKPENFVAPILIGVFEAVLIAAKDAQAAANPDYSSGRKPHQPAPGVYDPIQHARNLGEL